MFGLEWWILVLLTVFCNLIWPPITLAITLWYGIRSTKQTLSYAQSIEKKVTDAIKKQEETEQTEDMLAAIVEQQGKDLKQMLDGFRGDVIKKVENEIKTAKDDIKAQSNGGKGPGLQEMLAAGAMSLLGQ